MHYAHSVAPVHHGAPGEALRQFKIITIMKKTVSLIITLACLAFTTARATTTHEGPSSEYVYVEYGMDNPIFEITRDEWVQNWSITAPNPYSTRHTIYSPAWALVIGYSSNFVCDNYVFGSYTDCYNEYELIGTTYLTWTPPPSPIRAGFTWPQLCVGSVGYMRDAVYTDANGVRNDIWVSSRKRFRIGGDNMHQHLVTFTVLVWDVNPITGDLTQLDPATNSFYVNNTLCAPTGNWSAIWPADNAWHSLTVTVAGHPNIRYSITFYGEILW